MKMILILGVTLSQALLAAPTPTPTPTTPSVPPPPIQSEPPTVAVAVTTERSGADLIYRTVVSNAGTATAATTVTQRLPDGVTTAAASDKGGIHGGRIQWAATVPAGGMITVISRVTVPMPRPRTISSVCVADLVTGNALDCTSAVAAAVEPPGPPLWRRLLPWAAGGLLAVVVLVGGWLWLRRRKRIRASRPARAPRAPRAPRPARDRTRTAVSISAVAVLGTAAAGLLLFVPVMKSTVTRMTGTQGGGWSGTQTPLSLGTVASDSAVEFTVYEADCTSGADAVCTVVAAVRNTSGREQQFYRSMQRLYTGPNEWVTPDRTDEFSRPLAAEARQLFTLHFALPDGQHPMRLELREGAFARGVYYDL
jgi:hypothetical protein